MPAKTSLANICGLLIDLDEVLYTGKEALPGARDALHTIRQRGLVCRFLTNTTTKTASEVVAKLAGMGFEIKPEEIVTPVIATKNFLNSQSGGKPKLHLLIRESVLPDFEEFPQDDEAPDYVIVGDIGAQWSYPLLNKAFRQLMHGADLIAMHKNKFFQADGGLALDIGAFVAGLEYVTGRQATIIGKPSPDFFDLALQSMDLPAEKVAMIGDDIESDVGGGQNAGLTGILVQTGKYRADYVAESEVEPDAMVNSFADLPNRLLLEN
ncbi:MAG: TIGR01458 family HAD-type hydrolase [Verrucomicrobia bacterium]|nr:TIGR01458 family HAD-type hydrolase [Verrucomicrobiota bacterium]